MCTFVRQDMGLESMIQYSSSNNPVEWIQFLRALDQPDLPGWPLITPIKVQMLKCEKCSSEFCSPINFRRHARIHRRSLKLVKEPQNLRDSLTKFWDKSSVAERKKVVSFEGVMLKKIPGSSVIEALAGALLEQAVWALPQAYLKAGSKLLEIVQARAPLELTSSQELFSILDDASEGTFLRAGTAEDVLNYVFDREAANSLEFKNLVARTSFLFELQLVKACLADKDAEALRCQKLLVEEEEASLKRQARLFERRKQKKLRQKEQKAKEQLCATKQDTSFTAFSAGGQALSEESIPSSSSEAGSSPGNGPADLGTWVDSMLLESKESKEHSGFQIEITDECADQRDSEPFEPSLALNERQSFEIRCLQESGLEMERASMFGLMPNPNIHSKPEVFEKSDGNADDPPHNSSKVLSSKYAVTGDDSVESWLLGVTDQHIDEGNRRKVVIGSLFIPLNSFAYDQHCPCSINVENEVHVEPAVLDPSAAKGNSKAEAILFGSKHVAGKPDTDSKGISPLEVVIKNEAMQNEIFASPSKDIQESGKHQHPVLDSDGSSPLRFSSTEAKEFLTKRWRQTVSIDHVKLCLKPDHGT